MKKDDAEADDTRRRGETTAVRKRPTMVNFMRPHHHGQLDGFGDHGGRRRVMATEDEEGRREVDNDAGNQAGVIADVDEGGE